MRKIDILHMQECRVTSETFQKCDFIKANFQIFANNSESEYGTCSLVKNNIEVKNVKIIPGGRIIAFDIDDTTLFNIYLPSGTAAKAEREEMVGSLLSNMMLDAGHRGIAMGDFNCLDNALDATHSAEQKISSSLKRFTKIHSWQDCYRKLHPNSRAFSFAYKRHMGEAGLTEGAARLDRSYSWGGLECTEAGYWPLPFSDHWGHEVKIQLSNRSIAEEPLFRPYFKVKPDVAKDEEFISRVDETVNGWLPAKEKMPLTEWWEVLKKDVRMVAKEITRKRKKERKQRLTFLMLLQTHLANKVSGGQLHLLDQLREAQLNIKEWFEKRAEEVAMLAKIQDVQENEKMSIYHHEKLYNVRKKSHIVKLLNKEGILVEGHNECAKLLNNEAKELLREAPNLDHVAQEELLESVNEVFTKHDNEMLEKDITDEEVKESLLMANRASSPGSDGLTFSVYIHCWQSLGPHLCQVIREIVKERKMCESMRHSFLIYSPKVGKEGSRKIKDLRKLALLQADFKVLSGVLVNRLKKTENHTLSEHQYSSGGKKISHGVCRMRNAIESIKPTSKGCAVIETDFASAFDFMSVSWIWKVLKKKGCSEVFISVLRNLYEETDCFVSCIVNNEQQEKMVNRRKNIRQGDRISTTLYSFAADGLLISLNKRLKGLEYFKLDTSGPRHPLFGGPQPVKEKLTVIGFVDDVKGLITSVKEFDILDRTLSLFEKATGSRLHRNAESRKCNSLTLGRWSRWSQADSPLNYMSIVSEINMLGVTLGRNSSKSRAANGEELVKRVQKKLSIYKSGRFSPLTCKPFTANTYLLSKITHRCGVISMRAADTRKIQSLIKTWITQELLQKPPEMILFRDPAEGGLGLISVEARSTANLIKNFVDLGHEKSKHKTLYMSSVYRAFVSDEDDMRALVKRPTFLPQVVYDVIKEATEDDNDMIVGYTTKTWQERVTKRFITHNRDPQTGICTLIPTKQEDLNSDTDWDNIWQNMRCKGLTPSQSSYLFKMVHNLLPHNSKLLQFGLKDNDICNFCTQSDSRSHLWVCPQAAGLGSAVKQILEKHAAHNQEVPWDELCRLEVDLHQQFTLQAMILIAEVGSHISACRAKEKKSEPELVTAALRTRAAALQANKKYEQEGSTLNQWIESYFLHASAPS